ncbi:MAG: phosphotransferase [Idiomarina sp.]|nr:phosphotransferase [Idiomarina sp.]
MRNFPHWCLAQLSVSGPWKIEPIGEQLTNRTWKIDNGQKQFLVKNYRHDHALGRNAHQVVALDKQVAEAGMGPRVEWASEAEGLVVSEFLVGNLVELRADEVQRIRTLGSALAKIHHLRPDQPRWTLRERLHRYCEVLERHDPELAARCYQDVESYERYLTAWEEGPRVFCHHDLSIDHIFLTPEIKIIDWEYAGYSNPAADLAMTVIMNDLHDEQIDWVLEGYNELAPYPLAREELPDWLRLVALVNRIWDKVQNALQKSEPHSV